MKNLSIFLIALMLASAVCAQKTEIPVTVKTAFEKLHPHTKAKWEKEKENFEASFEVNEQDYSLVFDANGKVLETEVEIAMSDLPTAVKDYIHKNHPKAKIKETAKITDSQGLITYEVELKDKEFLFDEKGNFLKEVKD